MRLPRALSLAALGIALACSGERRERGPATVLFLTDFGVQDGAVAVCKGVMWGIEPRLRSVSGYVR